MMIFHLKNSPCTRRSNVYTRSVGLDTRRESVGSNAQTTQERADVTGNAVLQRAPVAFVKGSALPCFAWAFPFPGPTAMVATDNGPEWASYHGNTIPVPGNTGAASGTISKCCWWWCSVEGHASAWLSGITPSICRLCAQASKPVSSPAATPNSISTSRSTCPRFTPASMARLPECAHKHRHVT